MKTKRFLITIPQELFDEIVAMAKSFNISLSDLSRIVLRNEIIRFKKGAHFWIENNEL